jgi:hypothetical protein
MSDKCSIVVYSAFIFSNSLHNMYQQHEKLAHLAKEEINDLIVGYSGEELISKLIERFSIDCQPNQLYGLLPPIFIESMNCPACGEQMARRRPRRGTKYSNEPIHCPSCKHNLSGRCECNYCLQLAQQAKQSLVKRKRELIAELCKRKNHGVVRSLDIEKISLKSAVAFLALVRSCGYSAQSDIFELDEIEKASFPFSPQGLYIYDVVENLVQSDLIAVSGSSATESFEFEGEKIAIYWPKKVRWMIRYESPNDLIQEIESRARNGLWPSSWIDQVKELWTELAIAESMEFFRYMAMKRGFPESGERATTEMLQSLLKSYSVAQAMYIIFKGARDAADFSVRKNCSLQHASNYMIGACQRYADKAIAEKWNISGLRRNHDLPQSTLSALFHDVFLLHGEKGFLECPREWH